MRGRPGRPLGDAGIPYLFLLAGSVAIIAGVFLGWQFVGTSVFGEPEAQFQNTFTLTRGIVASALVLAFTAAVTWRHARRAALRIATAEAGEAKFRGLLEAAPDGIVITDRAGTIVLANSEAERLFGYRSKEMLGMRVEQLVPEDLRDRHVQHRRGFGEEPRTRPMGAGRELFGRRKDGSAFPVEISLSPIDDPEAGLLVTAVIRDITARRRDEADLRARALQQAALAELGQEALTGTDLPALRARAVQVVARVLDVEFCKVLELEEDGAFLAVRAGVGWDEGVVPLETISANPATHAGFTLTSKVPVIVADARTDERFRPTQVLQQHRVVSGISVPIPGEAGPYGVLAAHTRRSRAFTPDDAGFLTSVANVLATALARRRAEEARIASMEQFKEVQRLREMDRFKTQFINTAAHELGTPLTPLKVELHMLSTDRRGQLRPEQRKSVTMLTRNVDRLGNLVEDLLEVARLQAQRLGIQKQPMDLNRAVFESVESFQAQARQGGITLQLRTEPDLRIEADARRVTQVLFNLLSNALKFTRAGGTVTVTTSRDGDVAMVRVEDDGLGIRAQDIPRLFQPFTQVHDPMQTTKGGTGLGLYISRGLVELHGGTMWAESRGLGTGTAFTFTLPLEGSMPAPRARAPEPVDLPPKEVRDRLSERAKELI